METRTASTATRLWTTVSLTFLLCAVFIMTTHPVHALTGDLPPRPTVETAKSDPVGALISLDVGFPATWAWDERPWQSVRTQVQWQTGEGDWVDVQGWHGAPDDVTVDAEGYVQASKTWWVAPRDYGSGPYRWEISIEGTPASLAASAPFTLPTETATTATVAVDID